MKSLSLMTLFFALISFSAFAEDSVLEKEFGGDCPALPLQTSKIGTAVSSTLEEVYTQHDLMYIKKVSTEQIYGFCKVFKVRVEFVERELN